MIFILNELRSHKISPRVPALPGPHMCQPVLPCVPAEELSETSVKVHQEHDSVANKVLTGSISALFIFCLTLAPVLSTVKPLK